MQSTFTLSAHEVISISLALNEASAKLRQLMKDNPTLSDSLDNGSLDQWAALDEKLLAPFPHLRPVPSPKSPGQVTFAQNQQALKDICKQLTDKLALAWEIHKEGTVSEALRNWEALYDLVFGEHTDRVRTLAQSLGLPFYWCDPDGSSQEDVTAYIHALQAYTKEL